MCSQVLCALVASRSMGMTLVLKYKYLTEIRKFAELCKVHVRFNEVICVQGLQQCPPQSAQAFVWLLSANAALHAGTPEVTLLCSWRPLPSGRVCVSAIGRTLPCAATSPLLR